MTSNSISISWKMWSNIIEHYKDPHLVAKIQEYFGIEINYDKNESQIHEFDKDIPTKNEKNGLNDVKPSSSINGFVIEENYSTTRTRHKEVQQPTRDNATAKFLNKNEQPYTIKNYYWYYLFLFGTELGDEIFYSIFIPFWLWNIDGSVGRRMVLVWTIIMLVGQVLKDIICWPRPSCPPAVRLQNKWSIEYGMPSTHAMIAVCIPFSVLFFTKDKYVYSFSIGFTIAVLWCALICVSRVYLGMHSVLDVIAGLILAIIMMFILIPSVEMFDDYFVTNSWAMLSLIIFCIVIIVYYPTSDKWTPTRGDTTLVVSTGTGVHLGFWLNYKTGYLSKSIIPVPHNIFWPTTQIISQMFLRTTLGFIYIIITKTVVKSLVCTTTCAILKVDPDKLKKSENSLENKNKILVDLLQKFAYSFVISCSMTCLLPKIFAVLGIQRSTFDTEL